MRVVKVGGGVLDSLESFDEVLRAADVVVHGSSDYVDDLSRRLGVEVRRLTSASGVEFRYTPKEVLQVYLMGTMRANKRIVSYLQSRGINAVGLSGLDMGMIRAERKRLLKVVVGGRKIAVRDDYSGIIRRIDVEALRRMKEVAVPVIAPIAMGERFEPLNVDGDKLSQAIALSLRADELVFLTNVAFSADGEVVNKVKVEELGKYLVFAEGGMRRKLLAARASIEGGVRRVVIKGLDGETVIE